MDCNLCEMSWSEVTNDGIKGMNKIRNGILPNMFSHVSSWAKFHNILEIRGYDIGADTIGREWITFAYYDKYGSPGIVKFLRQTSGNIIQI